MKIHQQYMVGNRIDNMNFFIKILIIFLFLSVGKTTAFAQECKETLAGYTVEKVEVRNPENYKEWQKVKTKYVTLYTPKELEKTDKNCYEGDCNIFKSNETSMLIDTNEAAFYPIYEKTYPSYSEKVFCISGKLAWFWSYKQDQKNKYLAGVFFYFEENPKRRFGIYFNSKNKDIKQTAEKIIKSIEFMKNSK